MKVVCKIMHPLKDTNERVRYFCNFAMLFLSEAPWVLYRSLGCPELDEDSIQSSLGIKETHAEMLCPITFANANIALHSNIITCFANAIATSTDMCWIIYPFHEGYDL